ncbi:MAG: FxLD family lanthipeptide [Pseudonocardiaceae bacterium]
MPSTTADDSDFDLDVSDVSIVESGDVVAALMRNTDDNRGQTCPDECASGAGNV